MWRKAVDRFPIRGTPPPTTQRVDLQAAHFGEATKAAPIDAVRRLVDTDQAAALLLRAPQTLRKWSCLGGPITPVRVAGRLGWALDDIERLRGGGL